MHCAVTCALRELTAAVGLRADAAGGGRCSQRARAAGATAYGHAHRPPAGEGFAPGAGQLLAPGGRCGASGGPARVLPEAANPGHQPRTTWRPGRGRLDAASPLGARCGRASSVGGLMGSDAVRLFLDRARSRLPGFELGEENAGAMGRICRKLEGIPLAIELAAARMGALAVEQVAQRLEDSLKLLAGGNRIADPRQQTLRATLDWSHELLSQAEGNLFGRLSVFAGAGRSRPPKRCARARASSGRRRRPAIEAGGQVAGDGGGAAEGALRYRMLEPVRQYARERLEESGEADAVLRRHAACSSP